MSLRPFPLKLYPSAVAVNCVEDICRRTAGSIPLNHRAGNETSATHGSVKPEPPDWPLKDSGSQ